MQITAWAPLSEQIKVCLGLHVFKSVGACKGKSELVSRLCEQGLCFLSHLEEFDEQLFRQLLPAAPPGHGNTRAAGPPCEQLNFRVGDRGLPLGVLGLPSQLRARPIPQPALQARNFV